MSTKPECRLCKGTDRVQFNMFPKTSGFKFGEICVPCETEEEKTK